MDEAVKALAFHRLEQAAQCIKSARALVDIDDYRGAANRSYYAIFHSMRSVLALEQLDFSKHSAVSAYFRKQYIKTGVFEVELSDIITEAFDVRSDSDYDDYYLISKTDVLEQIHNAEQFLTATERYVRTTVSSQA